jgi:hypothetical protein
VRQNWRFYGFYLISKLFHAFSALFTCISQKQTSLSVHSKTQSTKQEQKISIIAQKITTLFFAYPALLFPSLAFFDLVNLVGIE